MQEEFGLGLSGVLQLCFLPVQAQPLGGDLDGFAVVRGSSCEAFLDLVGQRLLALHISCSAVSLILIW
jgi:hypothetical protein